MGTDKTKTNRQPLARFAPLWHKVVTLWQRSYLSHRSEFSVERLLAFRDYQQRTSTTRVIFVCALTPVPALLVTLAIDCIPLVPPSKGWRANYAVWFRLTTAMFFEALGVVLQVREVIIPGTISNARAVGIALSTAISSVLFTIGVADAWMFPIPFGYVLLLGPYVLLFCASMLLGIGPRALTSSSLLRQQIKAQLFIIANQGVVAVCYPIFSAVFNRLSATQQAFFVFVMPLIKFSRNKILPMQPKTLTNTLGRWLFSLWIFSTSITSQSVCNLRNLSRLHWSS
eukprot:jgi/Phyca11/114005/e_gw1.25.379.1